MYKRQIQCCLAKNATVTVCHSKTKNIEEYTKKADLLIAAIGKAKFFTKDMVKKGVVIIDVGINRNEQGKLVGDVDFENVEPLASYITPVSYTHLDVYKRQDLKMHYQQQKQHLKRELLQVEEQH